MKKFIIGLSIVAISLGSLTTTSYGSRMHHSNRSHRPNGQNRHMNYYYENSASEQNTIVNSPNSKVLSENILPLSNYMYRQMELDRLLNEKIISLEEYNMAIENHNLGHISHGLNMNYMGLNPYESSNRNLNNRPYNFTNVHTNKKHRCH